MATLHDYIDANFERFLEELKEFLRIPSISTDPTHQAEVRKGADWLAEKMEAVGIPARVNDTDGHPIVTGEKMEAGAGAPTLLVYGHYDVQPPDPLDLWESGPFDPIVKGDDLIARGAVDDKGQLFIHVKAAEAYRETGSTPPVNLKYIFEGEEEIGSASLIEFVSGNREKLACDAVVVSDTGMISADHPSLTVGLRGLCYMEVLLKGPNRDLHSGSYGGAVENPANALANFIRRMRNEQTGRVLVPGFYDKVVDLTPEEREAYAALPHDDQAYREDLGVPALTGEAGYGTLERSSARPTLDVNGMISGFTGEGAKTIIPSWARAKISMRLVPNQDPEEIADLFEAYAKKIVPPTIRLELTRHHGGYPSLISLDSPGLRAARVAVEKGFGQSPLLCREGGSIPIVSIFEKELRAPVILLGFGLPDDRIHSPNEKFNLKQFQKGIHTVAHFLEEYTRV